MEPVDPVDPTLVADKLRVRVLPPLAQRVFRPIMAGSCTQHPQTRARRIEER